MVIPAIPTHVHVIGIRVKGCGEQSLLDTECLAEQNGGLYIGVESEEDLVKAPKRPLAADAFGARFTLAIMEGKHEVAQQTAAKEAPVPYAESEPGVPEAHRQQCL